MGSWKEVNSAYRTRDSMRRMIAAVIDERRPRPRLATVVALDANYTPTKIILQYPNETATFDLSAGTLIPQVGSVVRMGGPVGGRYIENIVSGGVEFDGLVQDYGIGAWKAGAPTGSWSSPNINKTIRYRTESGGAVLRVTGYVEYAGTWSFGATIFTLDEDWRPATTRRASGVGFSGTGGTTKPIGLEVTTGGLVYPVATADGANGNIHLDFSIALDAA